MGHIFYDFEQLYNIRIGCGLEVLKRVNIHWLFDCIFKIYYIIIVVTVPDDIVNAIYNFTYEIWIFHIGVYRVRVEIVLGFRKRTNAVTHNSGWFYRTKVSLELVLHYSLHQQKPCPSNCQLSCFSSCPKIIYVPRPNAIVLSSPFFLRFFFLIIPSTSTWLRANHLVFVTLVSNNRSWDISMRKYSRFTFLPYQNGANQTSGYFRSIFINDSMNRKKNKRYKLTLYTNISTQACSHIFYMYSPHKWTHLNLPMRHKKNR